MEFTEQINLILDFNSRMDTHYEINPVKYTPSLCSASTITVYWKIRVRFFTLNNKKNNHNVIRPNHQNVIFK